MPRKFITIIYQGIVLHDNGDIRAYLSRSNREACIRWAMTHMKVGHIAATLYGTRKVKTTVVEKRDRSKVTTTTSDKPEWIGNGVIECVRCVACGTAKLCSNNNSIARAIVKAENNARCPQDPQGGKHEWSKQKGR